MGSAKLAEVCAPNTQTRKHVCVCVCVYVCACVCVRVCGIFQLFKSIGWVRGEVCVCVYHFIVFSRHTVTAVSLRGTLIKKRSFIR
jgi:hypothetical protein